jgi:hypothetical protein
MYSFEISLHIGVATPPSGEIGVMSFPVCKQSLITRKRFEIEQKLQLTTNSKSGSAFQNPQLKLRFANIQIKISYG